MQGTTSRYRAPRPYLHQVFQGDITDFRYMEPIDFYIMLQQMNWSCLLGGFIKKYNIPAPDSHSFDDVAEILLKKCYGENAPSATSLKEEFYRQVKELYDSLLNSK